MLHDFCPHYYFFRDEGYADLMNGHEKVVFSSKPEYHIFNVVIVSLNWNGH